MRVSWFLSLCVMLVATVTFAAQAGKKSAKAPAANRLSLDEADEEEATPTKKSPGAKAGSKKAADEASGEADDGQGDDADLDESAGRRTKKPAGLKMTDADAAKIEKDFNYLQGYSLGRNLLEAEVNFNQKAFEQAISDAMEGKEPDMSQEDMQAAIQAVQKRMEQKMATRIAEASRKNKKEEESFLAANKKEKGVKTLPTGMQYKVLKKGSGKSPKANDTVKIDYEGRFLDDTKFDSSKDLGEPIVMRVDQFIPGWQQALPLMKVGDEWELFIPSALAYGPQGMRDPRGNQVIPPNSLLKFKLELLDVNPKPATKPLRSIKP